MLLLLLLLWSHRRRLKMILNSASESHGRRTSSSTVLPRPRRWRSAMKAGQRSHRCSCDSSSSAQSRQLSVSDIPVICCQRRRWGWCPQRNRMRSVRSAFWRRASSSSRGRVAMLRNKCSRRAAGFKQWSEIWNIEQGIMPYDEGFVHWMRKCK